METVVRIKGMENLAEQIQQHIEGIESTQAEIDGLCEAVESTTDQAREKLAEYQALKRQAAIVLDTAKDGYQNALALFRQSDKLMESLQTIKIEHDKLSRAAISRAETRPDGGASELNELKRARQQLRQLYEQVEDMRAESLLVADSQEFGG